MKTSSNERQFIEKFEGLILQAYDDSNDHIVLPGQKVKGTLTIGYGHTSAAGAPRVTVGQKITQAQADQILASDLSQVETQIAHLVKVPLTQNEFDALVSFQFNTGALGKPGNSLLKAINASDFEKAADDFLLYNRAGGKVLAGLTCRREAERAMFLAKDTVSAPATSAVAATGIAVAIHQCWNEFLLHWALYTSGAVITVATIGLLVHLYKNRTKNV